MTMTSRTAAPYCPSRVTGQYYFDNIVARLVVQYADRVAQCFNFHDDNAPAHRVRNMTQFLQQQNIHVMSWPAASSDLFPIEHVWHVIGRRLCQSQNQPTLLLELRVAPNVVEQHESTDFSRFIYSMPRNIRACVANTGGFTRYN